MRLRDAHPAERRAAVTRLLRETDLPIREISARTGLCPRTILTWNARAGWARPPLWRCVVARWPEARRLAVARLLSLPGSDPADIAAAMGFGRERPELMVAAFRRVPRGRRTRREAAPVIDPSTLRTHLRAHIARQIAGFDAALGRDGVALGESARVLRDLGGLKRLLDEVGTEGAQPAAGEGGDDGTERDLPSLRAAIARRYDGFVRGGTPA